MSNEPIEPDEVLPVGSGASLAWLGEPADADTSWITDAGFEVTRAAPPVGSVTIGIPGVGFNLYVPDEDGQPVLLGEFPDLSAEAASVARERLAGAKAPQALSQGDGGQGKGHDDTACPGCVGESSPLLVPCTVCGRE